MEERTRFVLEQERGEYNRSELCEIYGVSRDTGYQWWRRYRQAVLAGWEDRSRAPQRHPNQTTAEIEAAVWELRWAQMRWGSAQAEAGLERERPAVAWPARWARGTARAHASQVEGGERRRRRRPTGGRSSAASTAFGGSTEVRPHEALDMHRPAAVGAGLSGACGGAGVR